MSSARGRGQMSRLRVSGSMDRLRPGGQLPLCNPGPASLSRRFAITPVQLLRTSLSRRRWTALLPFLSASTANRLDRSTHERVGCCRGGPDVQTLSQGLTRLGLGLLVAHLEQPAIAFDPPQEPSTAIPHDQYYRTRHPWFLATLGHQVRRLKIPDESAEAAIAHLGIGPSSPSTQYVVLGHERGALQDGCGGGRAHRRQGRVGNVKLHLGRGLGRIQRRTPGGGAQCHRRNHRRALRCGNVFVVARSQSFELLLRERTSRRTHCPICHSGVRLR
mmetsp:Transcript_29835/g.64306  ORF Transcript_29835/g.64306 Transcript_29835/m.64306 type:complete len:275 (-) Transcript_29835:831-1655(-)